MSLTPVQTDNAPADRPCRLWHTTLANTQGPALSTTPTGTEEFELPMRNQYRNWLRYMAEEA